MGRLAAGAAGLHFGVLGVDVIGHALSAHPLLGAVDWWLVLPTGRR
ncbi:hypothetical protein MMEU_1287 [Mycobacterium marinum str. Europe]|nr:hypothetical protein MMEU_1287 [Mycobacterium marinum str. Europe]